MLGFDSYGDMSSHLTAILAGRGRVARALRPRMLLPLSPVDRPAAAGSVALPGHGDGEAFVRSRLDGRPWAPLKIASGCDRRCSFCAIPMFRGAFVSRRPADVLAEARWLGSRA